MPVQIVVTGAADILVAPGGDGTLLDLGYTRDGARIREDGYYIDVKTDYAGGEEGPPADIQVLGQSHLITLELTAYDLQLAEAISSLIAGGTPGQFSPDNIGDLMIAGGLFSRLVIRCINDPAGANNMSRNYPVAIFREPREMNKGSKFSTLRIEATCYLVDGFLYDYTVEG